MDESYLLSRSLSEVRLMLSIAEDLFGEYRKLSRARSGDDKSLGFKYDIRLYKKRINDMELEMLDQMDLGKWN